MSTNQLKTQFGKLLKDSLRKTGIKQKDLAAKIGISSSAVSQFMHGKIIPKQKQLNSFYEMSGISRETQMELDSLLSKIRRGIEESLSPLNELFFQLRSERLLNLRQLANLSGVPLSRLNAYEKNCDAVMTRKDAEKLAPILCCPISTLYASGEEDGLCVADPGSPYEHEMQIPVLPVAMLDEYTPDLAIEQYVAARAIQYVTMREPAAPGVVCITSSSKTLSVGIPGEVRLFVASRRPEGFRNLSLCRLHNGKYALVEEIAGKRRIFKIAGARLQKAPLIDWEIPVLELSIQMLSYKQGGV